jgi:hypothetical protein
MAPPLPLLARGWGRIPRAVHGVLLASATGLLSTVVAVLALGLTPASLRERWQSGTDDSVLHYLLFTSATQQFSFADNHDLGFPRGLNVFFSGQVDVSSAIAMRLLSLAVPSGFLLLNLFVVLTFAGVGATAYAFFRALRIRPWLAVLFGALFSLAPYHFLRIDYGHAFLANYWAVPLVGILALAAAGDETDPFRAWAERGSTLRARRLRRYGPLVLLGLAVATTGGYYFVFGAIVVGGVWLVTVLRAVLRRDGLRSLAAPTWALGPLAIFVAIQLVVINSGFGERFAPYFAAREPVESELYAGKLLSLVLPWTGSRIPLLDRAGVKYDQLSPILRTTEAPGTPLVASVGLILLAVALVGLVAAGSTPALRSTWFGRVVDDARVRMLVVGTAWTFCFYVVTGLGVVVAVVIGPEIRAWSRLSIVLILFGLAFVAILVERITPRRGIRLLVGALIVAVALVDQVAGVRRAVDVDPTADPVVASFVAKADALFPDGCGVVQLPLKSFPDSGTIGQLRDYDEALPYLYTKPGHLLWSYGSILGTRGWTIWQRSTTPATFAAAVRSTKACAVEVDRRGYTSDPAGWRLLVGAATGTATPTITSSDGRYLLFPVPGRG